METTKVDTEDMEEVDYTEVETLVEAEDSEVDLKARVKVRARPRHLVVVDLEAVDLEVRVEFSSSAVKNISLVMCAEYFW